MDKILINTEVAQKGKSKLIAFMLWLFLSAFSAHQFYLNNQSRAVFQLMLFWGGWITTFIGIGFFFLIVWSVWIVVDLFLISGNVDKINNDLRKRLTIQLQNEKDFYNQNNKAS